MIFVLKKFAVDESAETKIDIQGRKGGPIEWLLNVMKLGATSSLICTDEYVEFKQTSLKGFTSVRVPTSAVTAVICKLNKPISCFFFAAFFFILGIIGLFPSVIIPLIQNQASNVNPAAIQDLSPLVTSLPAFIISIIMFVSYFLGKTFFIGFENGGDKQYGIFFRPSVIEGVSVDSNKAEEAAKIINKQVLAAHAK